MWGMDLTQGQLASLLGVRWLAVRWDVGYGAFRPCFVWRYWGWRRELEKERKKVGLLIEQPD